MIGFILWVALVLGGLGSGFYLLISRTRGAATKALLLVLLGATALAAVRLGLGFRQQVRFIAVSPGGNQGPWRTVHRVIPVSWEGVDSLQLELAEAEVELRPGPGAVLAEIGAPEPLQPSLEVTTHRREGSLLLRTAPPPSGSPVRYRLTIPLPPGLTRLLALYSDETVHWYGLDLQGVSIGEAVVRGGELEVRDARIGSLSLKDTLRVRLINVELGRLAGEGTYQFAVVDPRIPPGGAVYEIAGCDGGRCTFVFTGPFHLKLVLGPQAQLETDLDHRREGEFHIFGDESLPPLEARVGDGTVEVLVAPSEPSGP